MPIWAAFAIVGVAYVARSVMRGFDFRPDMPMDAILLVLLVVAVGLVAWVRTDDARRDAEENHHDEDDGQGPAT